MKKGTKKGNSPAPKQPTASTRADEVDRASQNEEEDDGSYHDAPEHHNHHEEEFHLWKELLTVSSSLVLLCLSYGILLYLLSYSESECPPA
jgi:hypothetical protein